MSDSLSAWDLRRVELARFVAEWSKDEAKVGAVISDHQGRVIALGYNGFAEGLEDSPELLADQKQKLEIILHAEVNAALIAGHAARDGTIYVVGKPVCSRCAGVIIQSGIRRVVAQKPIDPESKWTPSGETAIKMFLEAGITFDVIEPAT
jgi:dCMP deaminase